MLPLALRSMITAGPGPACSADSDCTGGFICEQQVCVRAASAHEPTVIVPAVPKHGPRGRAPWGTHVEERPRSSMAVGGGIVLGSLWLLTWTSSWAGCVRCDAGIVVASFIPVLGPFVEASLAAANGMTGAAPFLVADGLIQGLGAGLLIAGLVLKKDVLVYDIGPVQGSIAPLAAPHAGGIRLVGRF